VIIIVWTVDELCKLGPFSTCLQELKLTPTLVYAGDARQLPCKEWGKFLGVNSAPGARQPGQESSDVDTGRSV